MDVKPCPEKHEGVHIYGLVELLCLHMYEVVVLCVHTYKDMVVMREICVHVFI